MTNINDLFQADLIDMRKLASYNDGVKYLLTVIDVFSKFAYVIPLYSKSGSDVAAAFEEIFTEQIPGNVQTDKGKEFLAKNVQKLFKKNDINFYVAKNPDVKAAVIERFNRTLKSKMYKYFTHANTFKYIDVLQNFVVSYNNTFHQTIKMAPVDVNSDNILEVYHNIKNSTSTVSKRSRTKKYKIGDYVRIGKYKHAFEKGYETNWSGEIFKITDVINRDPVVYKISDIMNEPIEGVFYHPELQRIKYNPDDVFQVDKVLKKRYKNGRCEVFVQWKNYPKKFNSWIPIETLTQI